MDWRSVDSWQAIALALPVPCYLLGGVLGYLWGKNRWKGRA